MIYFERQILFIKNFEFIEKNLRNRKNLIKEKPDILISFLETTNITVLISSLFLSHIKLRIISDRNNQILQKIICNFLLKKIFINQQNF